MGDIPKSDSPIDFINFLCGCAEEDLSVFNMGIIFLEIGKQIDIVNPASVEVLKLFKRLISKLAPILSLDACNILLLVLRKVSYSPLAKLKNKAYDISSLLLRLHCDLRQQMINDFVNVDFDVIDLDLFLKNMDNSQICRLVPLFNQRIIASFSNNVTSQEGAIYYRHLIRCFEFDKFKVDIWPFYFGYLHTIQEGEFYQSLLKYWIPLSVNRYESRFYVFIRDQHLDRRIHSNTLLNIRKKGYYLSEFHDDAVRCLDYPETSRIGLEIICSNIRLRSYPSTLECDTILLYIKSLCEAPLPVTVMNLFKCFFSQLFLLCHVDSKLDELYNGFFEELLDMCKFGITTTSSELYAQLLTAILDIGKGSFEKLMLLYRCPVSYQYKTNEYYQRKLKSILETKFFDNYTISEIENMFSNDLDYRPCLTTLSQKYYSAYFQLQSIVFQPLYLLNRLSNLKSLRSSDIMRAYIKIVINTNNAIQINSLLEMMEEFVKMDRFKAVLLLDMAIEGYLVVNSRIIRSLILKSFTLLQEDFETIRLRSLQEQNIKIYEAFINNVLLLHDLTFERQNWSQEDKFFISQLLVAIIQKSNLKRPVQQATNSFLIVLKSIPESKEGNYFKTNLLKTCLEFHTSDGNIRKNPETRLVIYAIAKSSPKNFLPMIFSKIFFHISHPNTTNSGLAAALNTLEILVSDNSLYSQTLSFMVDVITYSFNAICYKKDFAVRNAATQLLKAIINRFYGVTLNDGNRPRNIDHFFTMFPALVEYFFEILNKELLLDNAVYVLHFFSESLVYHDKNLSRKEIERFEPLMKKIAVTKTTNLSGIAAKVYFSLLQDDALPAATVELVNEVSHPFNIYPKHVITTFMDKRLTMLSNDLNKKSITSLEHFLCERERQKNNFQSTLSKKESTVNKFVKLGIDIDHEKSIWLTNDMPSLISKLSNQQLTFILERVLSFSLPDACHCKILSILKQKITGNNPFVTTVLIMKIVDLFESQTLLIEQYADTILHFYEISDEIVSIQTVLKKIRGDIETKSIHKLFIYVMILSRNTIGQDLDFFNRSMDIFKTVSIQDSSKLIALTIVLPKVYEHLTDLYDCMKIMFLILMNHEAAIRLAPFVMKISGSSEKMKYNSKTCIIRFLNVDVLCRALKDKARVLDLLSDICESLASLPDPQKQSLSFFPVEDDYSVPKKYVQDVVQTLISELLCEGKHIDNSSCSVFKIKVKSKQSHSKQRFVDSMEL